MAGMPLRAEVTKKLQQLGIQSSKLKSSSDINILLLGQTGVGKSTFINSLANYVTYHDLEDAEKANLTILIPTQILVTDKDGQNHEFKVGSDSNEDQEVGVSGTQDVKTYVFPFGDGSSRLRLIDTPGMGDTRGMDQDEENCENILSYIGQLHELHAICLLFPANQSRLTATFEYCVKQILTRLDKSACKNIVFILTNTKGFQYGPGETMGTLKRIVEDIKQRSPHSEIPLDRNVFCFENDAFRYLVASKNQVSFRENDRRDFIASWKKSARESWRLISYIVGDVSSPPLTPHMVKCTVSINEARRMINCLVQPIADISQLIDDNIRILKRHEFELRSENLSLDNLKKKLYIPFVNLKVIQLTQPVTVCANRRCCTVTEVEGVKKWDYKQRCHDPCYLQNVPKEIIGAPQLASCAAMDKKTQTCNVCGCADSVHMHIYYMTKPFDDKKIDTVAQNNITTKEAALRAAEKKSKEIKQRVEEFEDEKEAILKCAAKFANFLQRNAITPFNDSYQNYVKYMLYRERNLGANADPHLIIGLEHTLRKYEEFKNLFEEAVQHSTDDADINDPKEILKSVDLLYVLPHNGSKLKELYKAQKTSRKKEHDKIEYVHASAVRKFFEDREQVDKAKKNKDFKDNDIKDKGKKDNEKKGDDKQKREQKSQHNKKPQQGKFNNQNNRGNYGPNNQQRRPPHAQHRHSNADYCSSCPPSDHYESDSRSPHSHPPPLMPQPPPLMRQPPPPRSQPPPPWSQPPPPRSQQRFNKPDSGIIIKDSNTGVSIKIEKQSDSRPPPANQYHGPPRDGVGPPSYDSRPYPPPEHARSAYDYPPERGYDNRPSSYDYRAPDHDYRPPAHDYRPPAHDYRPPAHDYRPPAYDSRPSTYDRDSRPPTYDHDHRPPTYDHDYRRPPAHDYRPPAHDYRPPPTHDHRPPIYDHDHRPPNYDNRQVHHQSRGNNHQFRGNANNQRRGTNDRFRSKSAKGYQNKNHRSGDDSD